MRQGLTRCPLGADGSLCDLRLHGYRARKTGPPFPLAVVRCVRHGGQAFTVYPPGHVPYGRVAIVPDGEGRTRPIAPCGTMWDAAHDAAEGRRWPLDGTAPADRRTQGRWLERGAALLGLELIPGDPAEELVAAALRAPLVTLREARSRYASAEGWTGRAEAILHALGAIERPAGLLVAGHIAGLWGRPSRWDPGGQVLRPV